MKDVYVITQSHFYSPRGRRELAVAFPMTFQVFGSSEGKIVEACPDMKIEQLGPTIIDLNMSCSVAKVSGQGVGKWQLTIDNSQFTIHN